MMQTLKGNLQVLQQGARKLAQSQSYRPSGESLHCIDANRIGNEIVAQLRLQMSLRDKYYTLSRCLILEELFV
jgi:hypothetical protein